MKQNFIIITAMLLLAITTAWTAEPDMTRNARSKTVGGIEFIYIAGGEFMMGQPDPSLVCNECSKDEQPVHRVTLRSFWMSKYEITQKQYRAVMGDNASYWTGDDLPVDHVPWNSAKEFCRKFSALHGVQARLPYEAEWEYACKAGTRTMYYWGDMVDGQYCWYAGNAGNRTHPVGIKLPNPLGLYDMAGNVWEWCEDWYGENYYRTSPSENPKGPENGIGRVLRGGWGDGRENGLRSSVRCFASGNPPLEGNIGIRLVLEQQ
ncbi:MAG TPA: formylglycine-generating enzyme family protein [Spirochaetota bacterium]|nr:formylglycine-generating enzyme family protein [Spirochaetota bacterium]HQP50345.1 formylglycine-generating enzyme family protein [Spirochaetota bacterium]